MKVLFRLLVSSFFLQSPILYAQAPFKEDVQNIVNKVTQRADSNALEKIYIQTDKPYYATGDTMWFKAYLLNAAYLTASEKSGISYIEIANDQNEVVQRVMVAMYIGLGWGEIVLNERKFLQGNYTLRAYTNWMRNFDEHYIFKKRFYISSPGEADLLIHSGFSISEEAGRHKATMDLHFTKMNHRPLLISDFQVKINEGSKVWYNDQVQSSSDGSLKFNFDIPVKSRPGKLSASLQPLNKNEWNPVYTIPLVLNRPENTDLQFMPEGGYLVAGIEAHVAFKALSEDGHGAAVSGLVYNSHQKEVLSFQSTHLGMGSFDLHPQPGESYTARIKLPNGAYSKEYALPRVTSSGLVLKVLNKYGSDSIEVNIIATVDQQATNPTLYLIGQSRGIACFGASLRLKHQVVKVAISKMAFPTGIARFTLLNTNKQVLNERIVYIDHDDHLRINMSSNKSYYTKRDSVGFEMEVSDKAGQPVSGSFSIAVTDDAQVESDSLKTGSLKSVTLLTSDLKGSVEDPGYYFPGKVTPDIWQQMDNLLLAQGWVNYDWASVFEPIKPLPNYAEANFFVKGKVTNFFNKPVARAAVLLLSQKPSFVREAVTDNAGVFIFKNMYPSDTAVYLLQARNKRGRSFNVGIEVDEFKAPVFTPSNSVTIPWYVNIDSNNMQALHNAITYKREREKLMGGKVLKEVIVTGRKLIKDSKNLNEDGGSDFSLNQEDLQKAGKATLGDILAKQVKGFQLGRGKHPYQYFINDQLFHLVIDGIDIDFAKPAPPGSLEYRDYVKQFLDYYTAEDIKGIEVMKSGRYTGSYSQRFLDPMESPFYHAFVEVTTYGGSGPYLKKTPGIFMYRPLTFTPQMQFYSPKYILKDDPSFIDIRSTIYWSPNIMTDKNGKGHFSFYTADKPGTYTLIIEGCDMNGNIESTRQKIIVK